MHVSHTLVPSAEFENLVQGKENHEHGKATAL